MCPLTRRRALRAAAAGPALALAGCSALGGECEPRKSLTLTAVTDDDVAREAAKTFDELPPLDADLARAAADAGAATYHGARERPMPDEEGFLQVDGSYRAYAVTSVSTTPITGTVLRLHQDDVTDADGQSGDAGAFEALPAHDRRTFLALLETQGISYFELSADGTRDVEVTTYEVTAEPVDGGAAAVADARLAAVGLDLADRELSAEQRDILQKAVEDSYSECEPYSGALQGLEELLGPVLYVRYEGTWYEEWLVESH